MSRELWIEYISAMVHLYSIVPFEQVAKVISEQNEEQVSGEEIEKWITDPFAGSLAKVALEKRFVYEHAGAYFVGEWILEFDSFDEDWFAQQGKPYYVPEREELLKWSDPYYFHKPKEFNQLLDYLERTFEGVNKELLEGLAEDLQMMAGDAGLSHAWIADEFERRSIAFPKGQRSKQLMEYIIDLHNHTRLQVNRGHTPAELFETEKHRLKPLHDRIGRNDPCRCGSGKKYKKCCGK